MARQPVIINSMEELIAVFGAPHDYSPTLNNIRAPNEEPITMTVKRVIDKILADDEDPTHMLSNPATLNSGSFGEEATDNDWSSRRLASKHQDERERAAKARIAARKAKRKSARASRKRNHK